MYALYHIFPTGLLVCTVVDGLVVVCVAWYLGCLRFMCVTPQEQEASFKVHLRTTPSLFH